MIKITFIFGFILITFSASSQDFKYFETKRDYIYTALYIDSIGDTITNETLTIRILDRRWIGQPWLQKSVRYIYDADTADLKNYVDPDKYFRERNNKYFKKKGKPRYSEKETTGGFQSESYFYMHPPRTNQYRMLFYSAHPKFLSSNLENGSDTISSNLRIFGLGYLDQKYRFQELGKKECLGDSINVYQVSVNSFPVSEKELSIEKLNFYTSTFDAVFSFEYGFIKMHYEFKSGVRIEFDLVEVVAEN
jgi:hypothetical protein